MEMEDHNHHHHHRQHHHEQHQQKQQHYVNVTSNTNSITDFRQLMNIGQRTTTTSTTTTDHFPTAELFPSAGNNPNLTVTPTHQQHYEMIMFGRQVSDIMPRSFHDFVSTDSAPAIATATTTTSASTPTLSGNLEPETTTTTGCLGIVDASNGRWPRQETLTLLEIRSRLDPQFKEATQKGPLWDQLSR
jgi:hypothetical protein